jgi:multidrug resistance protein, MATE family
MLDSLLFLRVVKCCCSAGQVVALFIVGTCEYAVVWLGTDWDYEVEKGIRRNNPEVYDEVTEVNV